MTKAKQEKLLMELNDLVHKYDLDNGTGTPSAVFAEHILENILSMSSMLKVRDRLNKDMEDVNRTSKKR